MEWRPSRRRARRILFGLSLVALTATAGPALLRRPTPRVVIDPPVSGEADASPAPAPGEAITFNRHVAPILWTRCAGCHHPGDVGPFPLLTYRDAAKRAEFILDVTESRRMPPWKPEHGFGTFLDDPTLSVHELAILAKWVETGTLEGDPADLPTRPTFPSGWRLGEPDLVFTMSEPFPVPASGPDLYRAFVIPIPAGADHHVVAFEFRPGNRRVVHHSKLFIDPTDHSRRRDQAEPGPGFASFGSADIGRPAIWEWTPGTTPRRSPPGAGKVLKAGSDLVLFVHYHPSGKAESDQSRVGIYLSPTPLAREMAGIPLGTSRIDIPPGAAGHVVALKTTLPTDVHAYVAMPHAHYLLREIKLRATLPDGTIRRLLWIKDWDFNWQGQYHYARPVALPRGTQLELVGIYDNSEANPRNPNHPPRRVRFGPTSLDEMLGCHLQVIPDRPDGYPALREKWHSGL